jgi:hypothetical protein
MDAGAPSALLGRDESLYSIEECPVERAHVPAPARARVEFRRHCDGGAPGCFPIFSVGPEGLTPSEVDAITERVKAVDTKAVMSISRDYDEVTVWTGWTWGDVGGGREYHLRKADGTWGIVCGGSWVS